MKAGLGSDGKVVRAQRILSEAHLRLPRGSLGGGPGGTEAVVPPEDGIY